MQPLTFAFDLQPADYIRSALWEGGGPRRFRRKAAGTALLLGAMTFVLLVGTSETWFEAGLVLAPAVAVVSYLLLPRLWWHRLREGLEAHYRQASHRVLYGPHTLTIGDDGLESSNAHHRVWRSWAATSHVAESSAAIYIHTVTGNVYILPLHAVADPAALRATLAERVPMSLTRPPSPPANA